MSKTYCEKTKCQMFESAKRQIRADAIDDLVALINTMPTYTNENGELMPMSIEMMADKVKQDYCEDI